MNERHGNNTELSKYIWKLKGIGLTTSVLLRIAAKVCSKTRMDYCKLFILVGSGWAWPTRLKRLTENRNL